jgi:O-antigen/teichoic acid export membrane protein
MMAGLNLAPRRSLGTNVVWNLLGQGAPLLVAVVTIPPLVHVLGTDRFGLLGLAWVLVGYFSIFDLGIGRALTQIIASNVSGNAKEPMGRLVWTSLTLMTLLGIAIAIVLWIGSPWAIERFLKTPSYLASEAVAASRLVAVAVPFGVTATGFRGVLEARQAFFASNLIRLPLGVFTYVGPLTAVSFTNHIDAACGALLITRVLAFGGYTFACYRVAPDLMRAPGLTATGIARLLSFSGWMAVTNVVAPFMTYLDRFVIGSFISVGAIAFYATPFDLVTRLLIVPAAVTGVMFPAFASLASLGKDEIRVLFLRSVKYLGLLLFPVTLVFVTLATPGLHLWLGSTFAERSTSVVQWLAVGVLVNSLGQVAFVLVQGSGRPRFTGLLNLAELPVYLIGLALLVHADGILGAAVAWTARATVDAVVLFLFAARLLNIPLAKGSWIAFATVTIALALVVMGAIPMPVVAKIAFLAVVAAVALPVTWSRLLNTNDRTRLLEALAQSKSA